MAIPKGHKTNLDTLVKAGINKQLCLLECTDKITGLPVITICAVWIDENKEYNFMPLAKMFDGNPYEEINPPE